MSRPFPENASPIEIDAHALVSVLVEKLGGRVVLTQRDFDLVYGKTLTEDLFPNGEYHLRVHVKEH